MQLFLPQAPRFLLLLFPFLYGGSRYLEHLMGLLQRMSFLAIFYCLFQVVF